MKRLMTLILSILISFNVFGALNTITINIGVLAPVGDSNVRVQHLCRLLSASKNIDVVFVQEIWMKKHQDMLKNCGFPHHLVMDVKPGIVQRKEEKKLVTRALNLMASVLSILPDDIGFDKGLMILSRHELKDPQKLTYSINGSELYYDDGE